MGKVMAIMKLCLVLLLCMLAMRQCIPCEASRKMLMEVEAEGNGALLPVSRKFLSEEGEEANDMETELMLPDETESEKLDIEQQEPLEKLEKKKHKEDKLMLPESGDGDLPLEGSQDEEAGGEKAQKKKKKKEEVGEKGESKVSTEQERSTEENLQEEGKGEKKKARDDMEEFSFTDQTLKEDPSLEMGKESDEVEGLSWEASRLDIAETEMETRGAALLSENGEEVGGNTSKEKVQTEEHNSDVVFAASEQEASIDNTQQYKEEGAKEKPLKPKKNKKEEVERAVKTKTYIADTDEVLKSKVQDDEAVNGEALAEEITDEVTPADVIEREMQGGIIEEVKIAEEKQQAKKETSTTWTEQDDSKQTEGSKAKKKLKNPKTPKQTKSKLQVSEEEDAELKSSKSIDDKDMETKVKQKEKPGDSNSASELQGDSVVKAGETSELQSKQAETQDKAKSKAKKKKVKSSEKLKKEKKSSAKNEKKEMLSDDDKTKGGTKHSKVTEAKEEKKLLKSQILGEVDIDANVEEDTSKKQQSQVEKPSKGMEDELPTIEKQEENFDVGVQDIAREAQETAEGYEGSISAAKSLSSSAQRVDEDDDESGDFLQDFTDFSNTKFQDTALKVADHLSPNIQKFTDTSKGYFNKANQHITESFSPLVGKQFAPLLASLVSYGLLLVPLAVAILLFEHIRALLSLQKVLLFVNIYLAAYFATLLLATFIIGEPMNYFYKSSASGYVHLQLLQALAYIIYLLLQTFDLVFTCTSETVPIKVTVALQWLVAFTVGFHYYVTVFHRAMTLKGPHTNWKIYGIYSIAFLVLCLFARIKRVKKGYVQIGQADTDKKH